LRKVDALDAEPDSASPPPEVGQSSGQSFAQDTINELDDAGGAESVAHACFRPSADNPGADSQSPAQHGSAAPSIDSSKLKRNRKRTLKTKRGRPRKFRKRGRRAFNANQNTNDHTDDARPP
jgi:hypothetical protein